MKLDSVSAFCHNLQLGAADVKVIALSGSSTDELESMFRFLVKTPCQRYEMPEALEQLFQMSLFTSSAPGLYVKLEKLKKNDMAFFIDHLKTQSHVVYVISSTTAAMQTLYAEFKNQMLWLDLSLEKPWQKKDRYSLLIQNALKTAGFMIDKAALTYLLDNEQSHLDRASKRLETLMLCAQDSKKITLEIAQSLLPEAPKELDFAWIDQLLFKIEPLSMPECQDASTVLMFLGQMRYVLINALKMKSLSHLSPPEIKSYFPKLSPQALSFQLKKIEDAPSGFLMDALKLVYDKELELKHDFYQPGAIFIELATKLRELKLCPTQVN